MKRKIERLTGFHIRMILLSCFITGCSIQSRSARDANANLDDGNRVMESAQQEESKSAIEGETGEVPEESEKPQENIFSIGCNSLSDSYNPFETMEAGNQAVMKQIQVSLLEEDRGGQPVVKAKDGQVIPYQGKDYEYQGLSNLAIYYDEQIDQTLYIAEIRDDVVFSDGVPLTADDLIFTLYVLCDPSYQGGFSLADTKIHGLVNYQENNSLADTITQDQIEEALRNPSETLQQRVIEEAMIPLLTRELKLCRKLASDSSYHRITKGITKAKDILAEIYRRDPEYDSIPVSESQVILDLAEQYGYHYKSLAAVYGDENLFEPQVNQFAREEILAILEQQGASPVASIQGIQKLSDDRVSILTDGYDPEFVRKLMIPVYPLHYYGNTDLYDYNAGQFGFVKGNLELSDEIVKKPLGAGPYVFEYSKEGEIGLASNSSYYLGSPKIQEVRFQVIPESDRIQSVAEKSVDLTEITGSAARFEEIKGKNEAQSIDGNNIITRVVPASGYGYIGMNPERVKAGEDSESAASQSLRKALAVLLAVEREAAVKEYYGESATVIQNPMTLDSWYAPVLGKDEVCYGRNRLGYEIYSNEMNEREKREASVKTAREYLIQAGYQYDTMTQKFIEAPEGAELRYNVYVHGYSRGDHPCYRILSSAKEALDSMGISLAIYDVKDASLLWKAIDEKKADLWCAAWQSDLEPHFIEKYLYSPGDTSSPELPAEGMEVPADGVEVPVENEEVPASEQNETGTETSHYNIQKKELSDLAVLAWKCTDYKMRRQYYQECYKMLMEEAVEIPVYQRYDAVLLQAGRLDASTVSQDYTHHWNWQNELYCFDFMHE